MAMTGRFVDRGIRILAAAALLLAVLSAPIRPTGLGYRVHSPNRIPHKLSLLNTGHIGQFAISARPSLREADSLTSDREDGLDADIDDDLTVKSPPTTASFDVLPSPCPELRSERVGFDLAMAARPLRC
jgi:hypothetical protein